MPEWWQYDYSVDTRVEELENSFKCRMYGKIVKYAGVVELVDTTALGAVAARRGGSSPLSGTRNTNTP